MANIKIPYLDLKAQYKNIKPEIDEAIARVLDSCQFVLGPDVADFERNFGAYCESSECIAVNSGTSALHLALLAAGVGPSDEVITVPFTFVASIAAVLYTGARPVLVDIDPRSFTMDPALISRHHPAHQSHPASPSVWTVRRHGSNHGNRPTARAVSHRGCSAGSRGKV